MSSSKAHSFPPDLNPRYQQATRNGIVSRLPLQPPERGATVPVSVADDFRASLESDLPGSLGAGSSASPVAETAQYVLPRSSEPRAFGTEPDIAVEPGLPPEMTAAPSRTAWLSLVPAALLGFGVAFATVFAVRHVVGAAPTFWQHDAARRADSALAAGKPSADVRPSAGAEPGDEGSGDDGERAEGGGSEDDDTPVGDIALSIIDGPTAAAAERQEGSEEVASEADPVSDESDDSATADADPDEADEADGREESASARAALEPGETTSARRSRRDKRAARRRDRQASPRSSSSGTRRRGRSDANDSAEVDAAETAVEREARPTAHVAGEPGLLTIDATPYATIFVDGERLGDTPLVRVAVPAGTHRIRAVTAAGDTKTISIEVEPGGTVRRRLSFD